MRWLSLVLVLSSCGGDDAPFDARTPDTFVSGTEWFSTQIESSVECGLEEIDRPREISIGWDSCGTGCGRLSVADGELLATQSSEGPGLHFISETRGDVRHLILGDSEGRSIRAWREQPSSPCRITTASIYENALTFSVGVQRDDGIREEHFLVSYVNHGAWDGDSGRVEGDWSTDARRFGGLEQPAIQPSELSDVRYFRGEHLWELIDGLVYTQWPDTGVRRVGRSPTLPALLNIDTRVVVLVEDTRLLFWHQSLLEPEPLFDGDGEITAVDFARRLSWIVSTIDGSTVWRDIHPSEVTLRYAPGFINPLRFEPGALLESETLTGGVSGNPAVGLMVALLDTQTLRIVRDDCSRPAEPCIATSDVRLPDGVEAEQVLAVLSGPPRVLLKTSDAVVRLAF